MFRLMPNAQSLSNTSTNIVISMLYYTKCTRGHWRKLGPRFKVEVGALSPNFFCRPLQNVKFQGTAGTHCLG